MLRRLHLKPSRAAVSNVVELAGLGSVSVGVWQTWGQSVGLIAAGVLAVVYGAALGVDR